MSRRDIPVEVIGLPVRKVLDTWSVDDMHGSRVYCLLQVEDRREVTLLRVDGVWVPVFVTGTAGGTA